MAELINGRWKQGRTVGEGGQAAVYLVTDESGSLKGDFALKKLPGNHSTKVYARFCRELAAIKKIVHPTVINIVDHSGPDDHVQFYVMEFDAAAVPLAKLLGTPRNPFAGDALAVLAFVEDVLGGLQACHGAEVIHRDLSPSNILVWPETRKVKIIDFGICQIDDGQTLTLADEGVGTQNYMAPECEAGDPGAITARADLYSVGKLLWSAVTNQRAFAREAPAFDGKSLSEMLPAAEEAWHLHHILGGTVRHNPADRFASAQEALEAAREVRRLVKGRYLPLERLAGGLCAYCGKGQMQSFQQNHMVFGNPNPHGIAPLQCTYCGYCAAINLRKAMETLQAEKRRT